jgi:1,2-diacylglycerol 3-alpha-glucosyltransferase
MRVGFFTEVYHPVVNGVVASIDALAGGLRELGHEVYCFAPSAPGHTHDEAPVYRIPSLPLPTSSAYRLTVPVVSRRRRESIINRLQVIHAHSPFVTGWMAMRYARRLRIPLVYTYHTRLEEYAHYVPFEENATRRAASTLTRNYANSADAVIVPTAAMRDRLLELGVHAAIEVIPTGIDLKLFHSGSHKPQIRAAMGVREGERFLLTVSRLAREKNVELLIRALGLCRRPARLIVAGDGPRREALEETARECGVTERVHFIGEVDRSRLPDLYANADAFVFASTTETQGIVLVEAMAAGAAIVAAEAPQIRDVLGDAGTVVAAEPRALAEAFDAVLPGRDPERAAAARAAADRFSIGEQSRLVAGVYSRLQPQTVSAGTG